MIGRKGVKTNKQKTLYEEHIEYENYLNRRINRNFFIVLTIIVIFYIFVISMGLNNWGYR